MTGEAKAQFHAVTETDVLAEYGHCFRGPGSPRKTDAADNFAVPADPDDPWSRESRHERQNSVHSDGFTSTNRDDDAPNVPSPRRKRRRSILRELVVPLAVVLVLTVAGGYAFVYLIGRH